MDFWNLGGSSGSAPYPGQTNINQPYPNQSGAGCDQQAPGGPQYPGGQQYPGQQYPGGQPIPGQQYPGGQPVTGQQYPGGQPIPGQQYPGGQPVTGQQYPGGQPVTGQQYPGGQPIPGQQYPGGQPVTGQQYPGGQPIPGQQYPGGQPVTGQQYPGGQLVTGQQYPGGQPVTGQQYPGGQPIPGQQYPGGQPIPGQQYPGGQPIPGQQYPGGQPVTGQQYPGGQPIPGQQYPGGQPVTGQQYPGGQPVTGQQYPGGQPIPGGQSKPGGYKVESKPRPTVHPYLGFNAEADCKVLRKAMKGIGTDEKAIIDVLTKRSVDQRSKLPVIYKTMFGKDLFNDLKSELSGNFERAIIGLCYSQDEYLVRELNKAITGAGTDERALIEILASQDNAGIVRLKDKYYASEIQYGELDTETNPLSDSNLFEAGSIDVGVFFTSQSLSPTNINSNSEYKRTLEKDLKDDSSGHFKRALVSLVQGQRNESTSVDVQQAQQDANTLYSAGEKKLGTDESTFNSILLIRSHAQLREIFDQYAKLHNKSIEQVIKSEMSGNLENLFLAIVRCARSKPAFFAHELHRAMEGAGTDDDTLIRIIVSRCDIDLEDIKDCFSKEFGKPLAARVTSETSGDYKKTLLGLING